VTFDTEHHVEFTSRDARRLSTRSISTRITEIDHAGTARERPLSPEDEHGFLWRMNSYWRYEQVDGGVIAEMESLTLSRNIPFALRFLVDPLVDRVARESVERTLKSFRDLYVGVGCGGCVGCEGCVRCGVRRCAPTHASHLPHPAHPTHLVVTSTTVPRFRPAFSPPSR